VPHVRSSVRGPKKAGEAHPQFLPHRQQMLGAPRPRISCGACRIQRTLCGFPHRKPHTRPSVRQRTGNPGSRSFFARCGTPLRLTCGSVHPNNQSSGKQPSSTLSSRLPRRAVGAQPRDLQFLSPTPAPPGTAKILPILITHLTLSAMQSSESSPSLRESQDEKNQSADGASNLLSHIRETEQSNGNRGEIATSHATSSLEGA